VLRLNNRGVALWKDKVISIALDGRMFAINKATGEVVWERKIADPVNAEVPIAPLVIRDMQSSAPPVANSASAASSRRPTSLPGAGEPGNETWKDGKDRCHVRFETRPRRIASSAISRWLQWLIGRSLSDGFSQVMAITAQICSGVYVAGAPERGASASRSGTHWAGGARRQRPRQYRTVFGHTPSSRALSRTPTSSAACNIMRARTANCCEVEWARTSASSASRCAGSTSTGSAANRGIATSRLSFRFVMPQRRRFDSCFVAEKQPRSDYLRTFT
jgi:hypothetical protein